MNADSTDRRGWSNITAIGVLISLKTINASLIKRATPLVPQTVLF